jgi:hypothetical protein
MEVAAIRWLSAEMAVMRPGIAASGYGDGSCEQTVSGGGSSGIAVCHLQADADGSCGPMGMAAVGRWEMQMGDGDGSCGPMEMAVSGDGDDSCGQMGDADGRCRWEMQMGDADGRWEMGDGRWRWEMEMAAVGRWRWQLWADGDGSCGPMEMAAGRWRWQLWADGRCRWEMQMGDADGRCKWQVRIASVSSLGSVVPYRKGINNPSFGIWPGPIEPQ